MSIFGTKKQKGKGDTETLFSHVRYLYNRVEPVIGFAERISEFQQDFHNTKNAMLEEINTQNTRHNQLQASLRDITIENRLMHNTVEQLHNFITIAAESKGALERGEVLSLGNACRINSVGYVMMLRGRIIGMGIASKRKSGEVSVGISVDGRILLGCAITLHAESRKHVNFQESFEIDASSVINFVCLKENTTAECTVASLLIELY